ncbi:hypothetical protein [Microbacterium gilvum]|uniref:Dinucleotide-utilizing enzyme n=1 Tax=Microbacterium gilvum TaxID=1336204 RepID=A0ABP8ZQW4_9MICO
MSRPHRLSRSVAYWALVFASVLSLAGGVALSLPRIGTMEEMLLAGTATGVEVYVGQAWITLAAGLVGAGALGIILALALAAAKTLVSSRPVVVEQIDWEAEAEADDAEPHDVAEEDDTAQTEADVRKDDADEFADDFRDARSESPASR